jgi:hypothetical protein
MKPILPASPKYPIGTIAAYGPDNKRATKSKKCCGAKL